MKRPDSGVLVFVLVLEHMKDILNTDSGYVSGLHTHTLRSAGAVTVGLVDT